MSHQSFEHLTDSLTGSGITKSNLFGMPTPKLEDKLIAGIVSDGLNFKLPADSAAHKTALSLSGAHLFQPEMHGKKALW